MISEYHKEVIDYFINELKKKEEFKIEKFDDDVTLYHHHLKNDDVTISIGYVDLYDRIEVYSFEKLFDDILVITDKKDVDETIEWLTFKKFYYN